MIKIPGTITITEASQIVPVSRRTINNWCQPPINIGIKIVGRWYVYQSCLSHILSGYTGYFQHNDNGIIEK